MDTDARQPFFWKKSDLGVPCMAYGPNFASNFPPWVRFDEKIGLAGSLKRRGLLTRRVAGGPGSR